MANLHFFALAVVYIFQVAVEAEDKCNCVCFGTSLNGNSVCQLLSQLKREVSSVIVEKERRTRYIRLLEDLKTRMELQEEEISVLKSQFNNTSPGSVSFGPVNAPGLPNLIPRQNRMDDINETRRDIKQLQNGLNIVTSFMERLDVEEVVNSKIEIMKETLLQNDMKDLHTKVDKTVYRNDAKKLNERLNAMETRLSILTNSKPMSQMSKEIGTIGRALEKINVTLHQKVHSEVSTQSFLDLFRNKISYLEKLGVQVEVLSNQISMSEYGVSELRINIQNIENKMKNKEKDLVNLVNQSILNERQRSMDQLEKFKTEWTSDCTKGLMSCFSPKNDQIPFSADPAQNRNFLQALNQFYRQLQGKTDTSRGFN